MLKSDTITELRIALTVENLDEALKLYREGLGFSVVKEWDEATGRGVILSAGRATLELIDSAQAEHIDQVEVGERIAGPVRLAMEFPDLQSAINAAKSTGARLIHEPVLAPWNTHVARLEAPDGMQITFFKDVDDVKEAGE
ncbi:MAG: VOC family protein [Chloroflexota bacterium]